MMPKIALVYDSVLDLGGVENHILSILENRDSDRFSYLKPGKTVPDPYLSYRHHLTGCSSREMLQFLCNSGAVSGKC